MNTTQQTFCLRTRQGVRNLLILPCVIVATLLAGARCRAANVTALTTYLCSGFSDVTDTSGPGTTVYCGGMLSWSGLTTNQITIYWYMDGTYLGGCTLTGVPSDNTGYGLYQGAGGPTWVTTAGSHTLKMVVDPNNVIAETNENDNSVSRLFTVTVGPNTFFTTGSLISKRDAHTATLLPSGNVLVAGGYDGSSDLASAELYNPSTRVWTATGAMATGRTAHTATLLPSGKVLVAGGYNNTYLSSAELYDPATGIWTGTGGLITGRGGHTATLLPNGKVLVVGGYNNVYLSSAELYDPATGTWTATGALATGREYHVATLLPNGDVLVAGGTTNSGALASAELYNQASGTWTATGALNTGRYYHTATLLPNGNVLVVGGVSVSNLNSAELYSPGTRVWTATGAMATGRNSHTATLLSGGKVLVAGGFGNGLIFLGSAELYDWATGAWVVTGALNTARDVHTATLLPNGMVLIAGGQYNWGSMLYSAELFAPGIALVNLSNLAQVYDGTARTVTAATTPPGLTVNLSYNGLAYAPTNVGSYTVVGSVSDANYQGSATNTLVVSKAIVLPTLGNLTQVYNGMARAVTAATTPPGLTVNLNYNGLAYAPTNVGSYTVVGSVSDANYQGSATNTLVVSKAIVLPTLGNLTQVYNGMARTVTAATTPPGLTVNLSYNGLAYAPTNVGSYTVIGSISDANYQGSATNILVVGCPAIILDISRTVFSNSTFRVSFSNAPGVAFVALASTNLYLPLTNWYVIGTMTEGPQGYFQLIDAVATNSAKRFYRVRQGP